MMAQETETAEDGVQLGEETAVPALSQWHRVGTCRTAGHAPLAGLLSPFSVAFLV